MPCGDRRRDDTGAAPSALPTPQLRTGEALQRMLLQAAAAGSLPHALQARAAATAAAGALELVVREHGLVLELVARRARQHVAGRDGGAVAAPAALPPLELRPGEALQRPLLQALAAGGLSHARHARAARGVLELLLREHVLVLELVARQARPQAGHPRDRRPALDALPALQEPALVNQHVLGEAMQGLAFAAL